MNSVTAVERGSHAVSAARNTGQQTSTPADPHSLKVAPTLLSGLMIEKRLTDMAPVRPIAPYLGGKRNLAKRVCAIIDADEHRTYAEPFVGMGGIFLRREHAAKSEFINDLNGDIYNLFRILQEHYVAFLDLLRFQITTQANFNRLVETAPEALTDLQRAARFLYLQRCAFGGKISGRNFGISADRPSRFNITTLEADLEALHERLSGVTVTCLDFEPFLKRIDRKGTFFYLDPPYWGCESDYGKHAFSRDRFADMAAILKTLKGKWLLSLNDVPQVRALFEGAHIASVKTSYSFGRGATQTGVSEVLISNFEIDAMKGKTNESS